MILKILKCLWVLCFTMLRNIKILTLYVKIKHEFWKLKKKKKLVIFFLFFKFQYDIAFLSSNCGNKLP